MHRLGIVGCGITGAVTAMLLKHKFPHINVTILEKSRGTGGRMCTSRSEMGSSVDLGAQFITKTSNLSTLQEKCYSQLLEAGLLQALQESIDGIRSTSAATGHFICPKGSGSLVKYFLQLADCDVLLEHKVYKITSKSNKWTAFCENGSNQEFDAMILTLPVPQILQLDGLVPYLESDHIKKLKAVDYCSRFALGFFYENNLDYFDNISWSAKFISDDIIRFVAIDHRKRNAVSLPTVVVHTTKEFGKAHIDADSSNTQNIVMERIKRLFPELPLPTHIKFHKWRYSQVETSCRDVEGCLRISESPLLICGGDGFSFSTFEGCIFSAENIIQNMTKIVT